ncbi:Ssl1 domain-containing protein [Caenorhabditis elegans]|uniref:Ssl1 domain-containing protein n=1 Tax=Caenorhabditis elegans TaxID=6239 RepID=Q19113_CAEEL|nr:Ssl1 domain-containing protein [Caenorhabditis elegans]CAA91934.5 Ssl1 domain-containing protein [Caenorhabditis elegans]|eukprot:NP_510245.4 Uncharacterized protein CELE_F02D10.3 [Caenorhabditis elegans]
MKQRLTAMLEASKINSEDNTPVIMILTARRYQDHQPHEQYSGEYDARSESRHEGQKYENLGGFKRQEPLQNYGRHANNTFFDYEYQDNEYRSGRYSGQYYSDRRNERYEDNGPINEYKVDRSVQSSSRKEAYDTPGRQENGGRYTEQYDTVDQSSKREHLSQRYGDHVSENNSRTEYKSINNGESKTDRDCCGPSKSAVPPKSFGRQVPTAIVTNGTSNHNIGVSSQPKNGESKTDRDCSGPSKSAAPPKFFGKQVPTAIVTNGTSNQNIGTSLQPKDSNSPGTSALSTSKAVSENQTSSKKTFDEKQVLRVTLENVKVLLTNKNSNPQKKVNDAILFLETMGF